MKASKGTEDILLIHAALVALTRLIPLPIVDDLARSHLKRRMVRSLAERRRLAIWEEEIARLAEGASEGALHTIGRRLAMMPMRYVLKRMLLLLRGKALVDQASRTYHEGFLIDAAFAHGHCAPRGSASPAEVRAAVDAVLAEVPVSQSPITAALREGLVRSREGLESLYGQLRGQRDATGALDAAASELEREGSVVAQMRDALSEVPNEHFEKLEAKLLARLA